MQLGRYTLVRRVGSGGMAEVWKAKVKGPAGFEKVLAIKRILPNHLTEQEYVDLFIHEAKLVAQLQHPNIVQVFDFGVVEPTEAWESDNEYYMAMEYVAGQNLRAVTKAIKARGARWPVELSLFIAMETARALAYAHQGPDGTGAASVIHRDISPHNVLVSYEGRVKVTDFGIARVSNVLPRTADGVRRGKIAYMSPEQLDLRTLDGRSDIFSLGATLYELLTNDKLFSGNDKATIANKIRNFSLTDLEHLDSVPGDIRYVLERMLQQDPGERYQDARDIEAELRSILGTTGAQEAPIALSSLVRELFTNDYQREKRVDDFDAEEATRVTPMSMVGEETSGSQAPTLISSAAQVHIEPDEIGAKDESKSESSAAEFDVPDELMPTPSRLMKFLRNVLVGIASLALIGFGVVLAKVIPGGGEGKSATPTAAATRVVQTTVTVTPKPTLKKTPTVVATPIRTARPTPRPTARPTVAAVTGNGFVSVAARPWCKVYIDGSLVAAETPLRRHKLSVGDHVIEARHPKLGKLTKRVRITKNGHVRLFVDVNQKTITYQ